MSLARKLRRREQKQGQAAWDAPLTDGELDFARRIVAWHHSDNVDELADLAGRTLRACVARGLTPLGAVIAAHVASCNSGGELGCCAHTNAQVAAMVPNSDETRRWVGWLKKSVWLVAVLIAFCWPSSAAARARATLREAHKIQRRNFAPRRKRAYYFRPWTRRKKSFGTSRQRSSCRWGFATGCGRGRGKDDSRGLTSKSSWFGGAAGSASATCRETIRISRSSWQTEPSSNRLTCELQ